MENNNQNNEKSQNQGQKTPNQGNNTQRERRPNPHRQNRPAQGASNNRPNPNANRKPNPNRKPKPTKDVDGNIQDRPTPNGNKKPNYNHNKNSNQNRNNTNPNSNHSKKPNHKNKPGNKPNHNQNRNGGNKNRSRRKNVTTVNDTMREFLEINEQVKDSTMNPWKKINIASKAKVRFTPLGGLGEIGGNMAVLETETTAIIIDVGMSFPDETMHGVDILVPDFSYLHTLKKEKDVYIIITHGHEDHIGAMPYLFKELQFPIYATPLALAMIENKFNEHGLSQYTKNFNFVTMRKQHQIEPFSKEFLVYHHK